MGLDRIQNYDCVSVFQKFGIEWQPIVGGGFHGEYDLALYKCQSPYLFQYGGGTRPLANSFVTSQQSDSSRKKHIKSKAVTKMAGISLRSACSRSVASLQ